MNDEQIREIAEAAFKAHFADIDVFRINLRRGFDSDDDPTPVVDVNIIYDGKYEQLNSAGLSYVAMEINNKVWRDAEDSPAWPLVHYIPKSSIGRRDPATVFSGPAPMYKTTDLPSAPLRRASGAEFDVNDEQIREIAEAAFKAHFADIDVFRINLRRGFDFDDDPTPVVDVNIIYDGKHEQLNSAGLSYVAMEINNKVWRDAENSAWPLVHYIPKSSIGRRDPATVFFGPAPCSRP